MNNKNILIGIGGLIVGAVATIFAYSYSGIAPISFSEQGTEAKILKKRNPRAKMTVALSPTQPVGRISLDDGTQTVLSFILANSVTKDVNLQNLILNLKGVKNTKAVNSISLWDRSSGSQISLFTVDHSEPPILPAVPFGSGMYLALGQLKLKTNVVKTIDIRIDFSRDIKNFDSSLRTELLSVIGYAGKNQNSVMASGVPLVIERKIIP